MPLIETEIEGLYIIEPNVYYDDRGCFYESYNSRELIKHNLSYHFVQDNAAESQYGVIRGLHYQIGASSQAKLVRVSLGEVLDVVIDLRESSASFGKLFRLILSRENKKQLLIPRGFAHGYSVLSPDCVFNYKCDNYYNKASETGINPLDSSLNIDWMIPSGQQLISDKDRQLATFNLLEFRKR